MQRRVRNPSTLEIVDQGRSPLPYDRAGNVKRIAIVDPNASEPLKYHTYFAPSYRTRGRTGKLLKKPVLEHPGAEPGTVAFLDYHEIGDNGYFIDYMNTRPDLRGRGYARMLVDHFYIEHADASIVMWGKIMQPGAWAIYETYRDLYERGLGPQTTGHKYFR